MALGGFDPLFAPAYEEDRDLSYRLLKRGHQIKFVPESRVTHHHETTQRLVLGQDQMQLASYKNSLILVWKNLTDWRLSLSHLVWLPYHLLITSIMSRGLFLKGLIQALTVIKPVLKKRALEKKAAQIRDQAILTQVSLII